MWYWPAGNHLLKFLVSKELEINNDSYDEWKKYTGITNLPNINDDTVFAYFKELKNLYKSEVRLSSGISQNITAIENPVEHRKKLLALYKK